MLVAVYEGGNDMMIFPVSRDGSHVGIEEYFGPKIGRDKDDYNITVGELPVLIKSSIKAELEREYR